MNKTPKLRFKEFSGELKSCKFKEVVSLQRGSSPRPIIKYITNDENGVNWVKIGDVSKDSTVIYKTKEKITPEGAQKSRFVEIGDLILSNSMSFGRPYIMAIDGCIHDGWFVLRNYNKSFNREYLCQLLTSPAIQNQYRRLAAGGVVDNISSELVNSVQVNLPSIKEQEKIAYFFSLIDKKISLQSEKVGMLKEYKKGMMQKIFNRELRFKDDSGRDYPEWEEKKLGDIANLTSSKRVFASDYVDEGIPFYRGKEITELKQNKKPKDILYITEERYNDIKNKFGIPIKGDLLLTAVGTLGNSYVINDDKPFYFKDGNLIWFKDIKEDVNFLNFALTYERGKKKIIDSAIGSTQKALTIVELNKLKFKFPSLDEQLKISSFFNNIDLKILKEEEKLDSLNEYKKGLLQQMFV